MTLCIVRVLKNVALISLLPLFLFPPTNICASTNEKWKLYINRQCKENKQFDFEANIRSECIYWNFNIKSSNNNIPRTDRSNKIEHGSCKILKFNWANIQISSYSTQFFIQLMQMFDGEFPFKFRNVYFIFIGQP